MAAAESASKGDPNGIENCVLSSGESDSGEPVDMVKILKNFPQVFSLTIPTG